MKSENFQFQNRSLKITQTFFQRKLKQIKFSKKIFWRFTEVKILFSTDFCHCGKCVKRSLPKRKLESFIDTFHFYNYFSQETLYEVFLEILVALKE